MLGCATGRSLFNSSMLCESYELNISNKLPMGNPEFRARPSQPSHEQAFTSFMLRLCRQAPAASRIR